MDWKKITKALLFPHTVCLIVLLPAAAYALAYSMLSYDENHPFCIAAYVLSAYTLTIWCVRIPEILRFVRSVKAENKYLRRWLGDVRLRVLVTLSGNVLWNSAYAVLQLGLGIYHRSAWFYALAAYYFSLALMRLFLVRHTRRHKPGVQMQQELRHYRTCGWVFLFTNLALSAMIFHMIYENRLVRHHEITTIAMAAYTFTSLTMAIINVVRYRQYNSPVFSASKAISLATACVSLLTLEGTMLTTFADEHMTPRLQQLFLTLSGGAISIFIVIMAIYMILKANQNMKYLEKQNE